MKRLAVLLGLALATVAPVACGADDGATSGETGGEPPTAAVEDEEGAGGEGERQFEPIPLVEAETYPDEGLAYNVDELTAKAGDVTIGYGNLQSEPHDLAIEDSDGKLLGKTERLSNAGDSIVLPLEPGEYTFYCTVPGHREAGMEGPLIVVE